MKNPSNPQEWQEAVDAASFVLAIESLRMYGLIEVGPEANISRCEFIMEQGRKRGYYPSHGKAKPALIDPLIKRGRGRPRKIR